ncbi:MAG: hypothetical protein OXR68_07045 [Alphaproteobacteria bacterium]|nr:hypothetical protein [Alphaproteobacteria bacterium]MDD9920360.1 hypothetical protein [Alphaproteobacteria bacterium]
MLNTKQRHAGYTIDQTILIVAIIAILITIIIATVGWDLISRTGGAKLAAQFRQIEDANGQFFAEHMRWPHQARGANDAGAVSLQNLTAHAAALADAGFQNTICGGACAVGDVKNFLPGLRWNGAVAEHSFGSGSAADVITMAAAAPPAATALGGNTYLLVAMFSVSRAEALEADEKIDGNTSAILGRVFYRTAGAADPCAVGGAVLGANDQFVNVCYAANLVQ